MRQAKQFFCRRRSSIACLVNNDRLPARLFSGIPAVFSHRGSEKLLARHARIAFDERAVAEAAARVLLGLGLAAFAFVPTPDAEFWFRQRERHFTHLLGINGHGHATYRPPSATLSPLKRQKKLRDWLAGLPKPLGVFAACDLIRRKACDGLKVADAARLFPCGRRMAEIRFRAATGHSMHEEIRAVRRAKARELRALGSMPRELIAASCGYAAWSSVHRLLKSSCRT